MGRLRLGRGSQKTYLEQSACYMAWITIGRTDRADKKGHPGSSLIGPGFFYAGPAERHLLSVDAELKRRLKG